MTVQKPGEIYCKTYNDYDSKIVFKNGVKYFGSIENGILSGKGQIVMPNGVRFSGTFEKNQIVGKGRFDYDSKEYYEGDIENL